MSRIAFVNGEYLPYEKSKVHIEDRGYQFADGVYEVFAVIDNKLADYDAHINRLMRSLSELNIKLSYSKKSIFFHISNIVEQNFISNGLICARLVLMWANNCIIKIQCYFFSVSPNFDCFYRPFVV